MSNAGRTKGWKIRTQLIAVFLLIILGVLLLNLLLNQLFLERYYQRERQDALMRLYEELDTASSEGRLTNADFDAALEKEASAGDIGVLIMDSGTRTVKVYAYDEELMLRRLLDNVLGSRGEEPLPLTLTVLEQRAHSTLQRVEDNGTHLSYLEMYGTLEGGEFFLFRTALENLKSSAVIAKRFALITGIVGSVLAIAAALILAQRITQPIRELSRVSSRMRELDFSRGFGGGGAAEVEELGENINELGRSLERNISELKAANNDLQTRIRIREEQEEAQRSFLSNVTHELKTPLALIRGYAEGIRDGVAGDPKSTQEYLSVIIDETDRMNRMVNRLLTLDHLETGQEPVEFAHFDLSEMVRGILSSGRLLADKAFIRLVTEIPEKADVWADPQLTEECFVDYYSNAVHHAKAGEDGVARIYIRIRDLGERYELSVENEGDPIPEEALPRIWDKFYRVDASRSRSYGGSGLGLSIVKASMERLHAPYGVRNTERGVLFYFALEK